MEWITAHKLGIAYVLYIVTVLGMIGVLYEYFRGDRKYITAIDNALYMMKTDFSIFVREMKEMRDNHGFYTERLTSISKEVGTLSEVSRLNHEDLMVIKKKLFELRAVENEE